MKKNILFAFIILLFSFPNFAQEHIVSFKIQNKSDIGRLPKYVSVDNVENNIVTAYIWEDNLIKFNKLGYAYTELPHSADGKVINMATTIAQMANWDKYPTYDVYIQMMQKFANDYPAICKLDTIGTSQQGRLMLVLEISDNVGTDEQEPEFFYTSTMHGDETTGIVLLLRLIDNLLTNYGGSNTQINNLINNYDIWINPLANPDGTYAGGNNDVSGSQRSLANGDDPNRDFPYPLNTSSSSSNPETIAMKNFASAHHFVMSANFHGGAEVMNYPWDCWSTSQNAPADANWWEHIATNYVTSARTTNSNYMTSPISDGVTEGYDWYEATGTRQDYMNYFHHCKEITVELSSTKTLSSDELTTYWTYNAQSLLDYIEEAIYGFNGTVKNTSGAPLNAKIEISGYDKDNSWVTTDPAIGDYYRPIEPGTYNVTYSAEGYLSQTISVTVSNWKTTTVQNVVLQQAQQVTLTGTVLDAVSAQPIQNATISFPSTSISDVSTDAQGKYSITIPENTYQIKCYKNGYAQQVKTDTITVTNHVVDFALLESDAITFETEIPSEITFSGDANWVRSTDEAYEGSYSIKSGDISDDQTSVMTLTASTQAGNISFYKKVSCEDGSNDDWDYLKFEIDGQEKGRWDGEVNWSQETYTISAGNHTFKWSYIKDGSQDDGSDCAWVDYIELPANQPTTYSVSFTVKNGATATTIENATVNLVGYGTKNTDASGNVTFENVYETSDTNSISYVVSKHGFYDATGNIQVLGTTNQVVNLLDNPNVSIKELSTGISAYPNPSNGIFSLNLSDNSGNIIIYDINGNEILRKEVNFFSEKLDLNNYNSGIYTIKYISNKGIFFDKIIIEK